MEAFFEGKTFYACGLPIVIRKDEAGETHIYRKDDGVKISSEDFTYGTVYGGTKEGSCEGTDVTMESGLLYRLCGGGFGGEVKGDIFVTITGGLVIECLYGGGIRDRVGNITMKISGGAVKKSLYVGGESCYCRDTNGIFEKVTCSSVGSGLRFDSSEQEGNVNFLMKSGNILTLNPAYGHVTGKVTLRVEGGFIEKRIMPITCCDGGASVQLYRGIVQYNTKEKTFPMIPEGMEIEWFDTDNDGKSFHQYEETGANILDRKGEKGKLAVRFLEIRDPSLPKYTARFSEFIGDCILINFPSGHTMLVDCGMNYARDEIVNTLKGMGIKKLDYFMITHHHEDHSGCAKEVIDNFKVGEVLLPKIHTVLTEGVSLQFYGRTLHSIMSHRIKYRYVMRGDEFSVGFGTKKSVVKVLNPNTEWKETDNLNENSIAIRVEYKESAVMLGADISDAMEKEISDAHGKNLSCDLLKLSHHGIVQQGNYEYIGNCNPKYVVVQNLREDGVFFAVSRYQLNHVHNIPDDRIMITGANGWIKAVLGGKKGDITIDTQYK